MDIQFEIANVAQGLPKQREPTRAQGQAKGSQRDPKNAQREPKGTQGEATGVQSWTKGGQRDEIEFTKTYPIKNTQ